MRWRWVSGWHWVREQFAFLAVLAVLVVAFGYLISSPDHPIRGTLAIAAACLLAALLRLVLPSLSAGMLVVRSRLMDVCFFTLLGGAIVLTDLRLKH